ncbi:hypothetical protein BGX23_011437 [Mortierella sp. AD031]|nr:hypothetical protein BGX23_011437 [Mortierella sp. AD031]
MAPAIFGLRVWLAFVALVNLSIVIAFHAWFTPHLNKTRRELDDSGPFLYKYDWVDYTVINTSVLLFLSYLYSICGKPRIHKYARAFLMLLSACLLLGVQLRQVDLIMITIRAFAPRDYDHNPFSCSGTVDSTCALYQSYTFFPIVTGFFSVIEVPVTLFRGPLHSPEAASV